MTRAKLNDKMHTMDEMNPDCCRVWPQSVLFVVFCAVEKQPNLGIFNTSSPEVVLQVWRMKQQQICSMEVHEKKYTFQIKNVQKHTFM